MRKWIILLVLLCTATLLQAQQFKVKVVGITDGDTFTAINRDKLQIRFRMNAIDAPERKQAFGSVSTQALKEMIHGQRVTVIVHSRDPWGRYVVTVRTRKIKDVSAEMIRRGMAWHYKKYDKTPLYAELEEQARAGRVGLWKDPHPVAPWDFR
ncbi:MAG: thermonuclease family protein [Bacteroidales bacterium]|jgi:endonuclease YncB( thermonuclease family)